MSKQAITLAADACAAPLRVIGVNITVLASREQTGSHEVTLQEGPEGAGPPPHSHGWDESFYVLRGRVDCLVDGQPVRGQAGSFIHVPAGTVHAFQFGPGGGAMLEIAGQGAAATAMFRKLDQEIPPGPPDLPKVMDILRDHGVSVAA
ncbi:cupin domain-containing protein [Ramlibacter sp. 2FC]|uniref:cupin domain-containing protein n=1 Tax=Ramlibacter sp. 2FC TaxID=2502188 RepID=UPI0010F723DC|nr:cupin domain-containing protein [Ramlibacter sp. 2FC]